MTTPPPSAPRVVEARFIASAPAPAQLPAPVGVEIAFAGRSNVGKSSLLNALMGRRGLARTSRTPGCTRQLSLFELRFENDAVLHFVDLPGYGYARRAKSERAGWAGSIEEYLRRRATLAVVVVLIDSRRGPEVEERDLIQLLGTPADVSRRPLTVLAVATKLDRLSSSERKLAVERIRRDLAQPVVGVAIDDPAALARLWGRLWVASGLSASVAAAPASAARS